MMIPYICEGQECGEEKHFVHAAVTAPFFSLLLFCHFMIIILWQQIKNDKGEYYVYDRFFGMWIEWDVLNVAR
jgi:hypothetical protein